MKSSRRCVIIITDSFTDDSKLNILNDINASELSTLKAGGLIKYVVKPSTMEELYLISKLIKKYNLDYYILGKLSNTLVTDKGYSGLVIKSDNLRTLSFNGDLLTVGSGVSISKVIKASMAKNLSGIEGLIGVPGSIGGAIKMNAGAFGYTIGDYVEEVTVFDFNERKVNVLSKDNLVFAYRHSSIIDKDMILSCTLKLKKDDANNIKERMRQIKEKRHLTQPKLPSLGSTFKRYGNTSAGLLIDRLSLKGVSIGGAKVSLEHGGFIVNFNNSTASDYLELMGLLQAKVLSAYGIALQREIKILGNL